MRQILKNAYALCRVGEQQWVRHDPWLDGPLQSFQAVMDFANELQRQGVILIREVHRDRCQGAQVDGIHFLKLR